jgi:hypothetical protein
MWQEFSSGPLAVSADLRVFGSNPQARLKLDRQLVSEPPQVPPLCVGTLKMLQVERRVGNTA